MMTAAALGLGLLVLECSDYLLLPAYRQVIGQWLSEEAVWQLFGLCGGKRGVVWAPDQLAERARLEQTLLRHGERQWPKRHVGRVLDEAEQERLLIRHAAERIQKCMAQVLSAWYEQQPADKPLCARLARQVEKLAGEGTLTLRVHPALVPRMRAEVGRALNHRRRAPLCPC